MDYFHDNPGHQVFIVTGYEAAVALVVGRKLLGWSTLNGYPGQWVGFVAQRIVLFPLQRQRGRLRNCLAATCRVAGTDLTAALLPIPGFQLGQRGGASPDWVRQVCFFFAGRQQGNSQTEQ